MKKKPKTKPDVWDDENGLDPDWDFDPIDKKNRNIPWSDNDDQDGCWEDDNWEDDDF